jgi:hypothetical protein
MNARGWHHHVFVEASQRGKAGRDAAGWLSGIIEGLSTRGGLDFDEEVSLWMECPL